MFKCSSFSKIVILLLFSIVISSCSTSITSIENEHQTQFKVNNPNASYFDVKKRMQFLKTSKDKYLVYAKSYGFDCSKHEMPKPVDFKLRIPQFYKDRVGWDLANIPLISFEKYVTKLSELYVTTQDPSYAKCLINVLTEWADHDSLLSFHYSNENKQAWFAIEWITTSAGLAYSVIRESLVMQTEEKQKIENWLNKVVKKQISYYGGPISCCNNHSYWRGLEAAIVGVISNDDKLFRFSIKKFISALNSMNKNGSFPLEMQRGYRAVHYQNFSVLPLVYIAEIANRQGYNLYDLAVDEKNLHLAIEFLLKSIKDPSVVKKYTSKYQDMSFFDKKRELNWMEPYSQRFQNKEIEQILKTKRPVYHRWSGGSSTLYFYNPLPK